MPRSRSWRLASLGGRNLLDSGRTVLGPSMVLPAAVGALGSGHLLGFQFGDTLFRRMTLAADSADVDFRSATSLVVSKLLALVASERFRGEARCWEGSPDAKIDPLRNGAPEGGDQLS